MAIYRISRTGTATTSGNPTFDVAVSTGLRPKIMELKVFLGAATAFYSMYRQLMANLEREEAAKRARKAGGSSVPRGPR